MESMDEDKKEGTNLLGSPTFEELENGRFKCVETGHEMLAKDKDSYSRCKRCRLGLIDFALSHKKPPLNMFKQDPASRSKLICKLTGDTVNKSEEHLWKHLNGKRFLNRLELVEAGKLTPNGKPVEAAEEVSADKDVSDKKEKKKKNKNKNKKKEKEVEEIISEVRDTSDKDSDAEEADFWMPPKGTRWDFDDGGDRWGSDSEPGEENDEVGDGSDGAVEDDGEVSEELSVRTKRMAIEIGPSSFASRKKKSKNKDSTS